MTWDLPGWWRVKCFAFFNFYFALSVLALLKLSWRSMTASQMDGTASHQGIGYNTRKQLQILTFPLSSSQSQSSLPFRFLTSSILLLSIVFFSHSQDLTMWRRGHSSITQHKQTKMCLFHYFKYMHNWSYKHITLCTGVGGGAKYQSVSMCTL